MKPTRINLTLNNCEVVIRAISVSDAPICLDSEFRYAIYRAEWAEELGYEIGDLSGHEYFIDDIKSDFFLALTMAKELLAFKVQKQI